MDKSRNFCGGDVRVYYFLTMYIKNDCSNPNIVDLESTSSVMKAKFRETDHAISSSFLQWHRFLGKGDVSIRIARFSVTHMHNTGSLLRER